MRSRAQPLTHKTVDSGNFRLGTRGNLVDSWLMTLIVFRHLPTVAELEGQLRVHSRGLLADNEAEELPNLIDDASRELFGITANDTLYPALPEAIRARHGRAEWEANFDIIGQYARDPNVHWREFGLDLCCEGGRSLHCLEVFGRQLICAIDGLHPNAVMTFAYCGIARAA